MGRGQPSAVADQARRTEVTWAGPPPQADRSGRDPDLAARMGRLAAAGATWMVLGWPAPLEEMAAAARGLPGDGSSDARARRPRVGPGGW